MNGMGKLYQAAMKPGKGVDSVLTSIKVERGMAVATDGCILAARKLDAEEAEALVPYEAAKAASKPKVSVTFDERTVRVSEPTGCEQVFPQAEGVFPPWERVLTDAKSSQDQSGSFQVALDAELLSRLAEALGNKQLVLSFNAEEPSKRPILVRPYGNGDDNHAEGLLMPIRL